jgi:uncharacterized membrane protein
VPGWWPLAALLVIAAAARLPTLSLQSLWYDEAYTPVHVLHSSLAATLNALVAHENTPPLWYIVVWALTRVLGTGVVALRLLSALAGVALVAVGWAIGSEAGNRRTAVILAAILALNPLFVWYSQEARAYELYALTAALSLLCFLRAYRAPTRMALLLWALSSILTLLCHYFAAFLVAGEAALLLTAGRELRRGGSVGSPVATVHTQHAARPRTWIAVAAVSTAAAALAPLLLAQAGRGTQWIGQWALSARLVAIVSYYLLGANGSVLGHGLLALSALPALGGLVLAGALIARSRVARDELATLVRLCAIGVVAILLPLVLALAGADYLAPRNLIADWVPLSAALALVLSLPAAGRAGVLMALLVCLSGAAVVLATNLDPRLQRPDWHAVAAALRTGPGDRAFVSVELAAAPLEYYLPDLRLHYLSRRSSIVVREVDLVGYAPLRAGAPRPPTPAFSLRGRVDVHGLLAYRYVAPVPVRLGGRSLNALAITAGASVEVLIPAALPADGP